ncbi:hypothetical protein BIFCAT_01417 [Bifidobacterium catenulatum DSM 16992 = JCM 1194 = LMG 11043]|uniref:Uncharacterized protein n=1 Tax=Bifidobacterium catenulatum DSM 16992 = JCM 1194 = LMG 11043 TaxID=566552 RepID=B6XW28_9BIFI|nr:hypothetical protein BIFCAT_01417 [Bifidobacterium catenulatum DSM 16992 = JCM 1194 = LMG 11043]
MRYGTMRRGAAAGKSQEKPQWSQAIQTWRSGFATCLVQGRTNGTRRTFGR